MVGAGSPPTSGKKLCNFGHHAHKLRTFVPPRISPDTERAKVTRRAINKLTRNFCCQMIYGTWAPFSTVDPSWSALYERGRVRVS